MKPSLDSISKKKSALDRLSPLSPVVEAQLEDWFCVELTYSSNAIEGNTLSRLETAEVLEKGISAVISGKPLKDQLEAVNHAKAIEYIKMRARTLKSHQFITEEDIKNIHKIILTGIMDAWSGKYRRTDVFIRGSNVEFPSPNTVPYLINEFIQWFSGEQESHPVQVAADAHYKFVTIHPFLDGNGRTARLLMNLILLVHHYPMAIIRNEERTQYLAVLETAQTKQNMEPFYNIIYQSVERSLDAYINAARGKHALTPFKTKEAKFLKIGEVAQAANETVPTIRYWTKEGLLKIAAFSKGGYQLYAPEAIERVNKIRKLQKEKRLTIVELKRTLA